MRQRIKICSSSSRTITPLTRQTTIAAADFPPGRTVCSTKVASTARRVECRTVSDRAVSQLSPIWRVCRRGWRGGGTPIDTRMGPVPVTGPRLTAGQMPMEAISIAER